MTGRLQGRVALITGSTSGIGRETARVFAAEGAKVVLNGRREALGQEAVAEIRAAGGEAHFIHADVADSTQLKALVEGTVAHYGGLDILMNNAWAGTYGTVLDISEEQLDGDIAVSLKAVFLGCKYAIPHMIKAGGGAIINIASVHGVLAARRMANYESVKAGIINLTRQIAVDFGHDGIRCNAICPGWILVEKAEAHFAKHPEGLRLAEEIYPLGRPGRMREIANAALFLASDESSFITGHPLMVDGGLTIQLQDSLAAAVEKMAKGIERDDTWSDDSNFGRFYSQVGDPLDALAWPGGGRPGPSLMEWSSEAMPIKHPRYTHDQHFLAVRTLLVETFTAFPVPFNWRLERWQYARHYVVPMMATYGTDNVEIIDIKRDIATWDALQGVWVENDQVVAAVTGEYAKPSDAFVQRRPGYEALLPEMLAHAIEVMGDREKGEAAIWVCDQDVALIKAAEDAGFVRQPEEVDVQSVYRLGEVPAPRLPEGYHISSMAEGGDLDKRREGMSRGFNHTDPREWGSAWAYRSMMQAPDYRPELDLFVVAPDGSYVSGCILWYDAVNRLGALEPVSTHPDYRRRGLGREVIYEGLRRAKALGAEAVWVGSQQPFYLTIGFEPVVRHYRWVKAL